MDQNEVKYDKLLKIKTTGRDDSRSDQYCYPYEPTPYGVLERLAYCGYLGKKKTQEIREKAAADVEKAEWIFFWRGRSDAGLQAWSTMNV